MKEYILCVYEFLQRRRENQIPGVGVKVRYELPEAGMNFLMQVLGINQGPLEER